MYFKTQSGPVRVSPLAIQKASHALADSADSQTKWTTIGSLLGFAVMILIFVVAMILYSRTRMRN